MDNPEEQLDMETVRQYACKMTWNPNTASSNVRLKDEAYAEPRGKQKPAPHHPERFQVPAQIMSREGLSSRHFFQLEWFGRWATIGMAYKHISRKGSVEACTIGCNENSWGIFVSTPYPICKALHGGVETNLPDSSPFRVGVYLDWPAGTLSFYNTTHDEAKLIHTFHGKFTSPLFLLVSISAGVQVLPDNPPPVCFHDHDPWGIMRIEEACNGCRDSKKESKVVPSRSSRCAII